MSDIGAKQSLTEAVRKYAVKHALLPTNGLVVVGVSGGVDSMCLLDILTGFSFTPYAVHVNYALRGEQSELDQQLVHKYCVDKGIQLVVHRPDSGWRLSVVGESLQEAARDLRYRVFSDVAKKIGARHVAVAHHMEDQVETMLLRLMRGTGLTGLAAMRSKRPLSGDTSVELVRPLLFASRDQIDAYVAERRLAFCVDVSNSNELYDRSRMRQTVIPVIRSAFGDSALANIAEAASRIGQTVDDVIEPQVTDDLDKISQVFAARLHLSLEGLRAIPRGRRLLALRRALKSHLPRVPRTANTIERAESLISASTGKRLVMKGGVVWRDRDAIVLEADGPGQDDDVSTIEIGRRNNTPYGTLDIDQVEATDMSISEDLNVVWVDAQTLSTPLTFGAWQTGERFQPFGMKGTKKISDFLTDVKAPTYLKDSVPVLRSGSDIVWVAGYRLAHPYRVTEKTGTALRIRFEPSSYLLGWSEDST